MKKSNYEGELEQLQQRAYASMIHTRELGHSLRLAQQAQTPRQPAPQPTGRPTRQPVPQPEATKYFSADNTAIFLWATKEYACLQCSRGVWGPAFIDEVLVRGCADGVTAGKNVGWLSRVDRPDTRCDICSRKISG